MPEDTTRYNGWANHETWLVNLWMDNDEGSYSYWCDRAETADSVGTLADMLKEEFEENAPETTGVYSDLLSTAMSEVDWYEIATHAIEARDDATRDAILARIKHGTALVDSWDSGEIVSEFEELLPESLVEEFELWDDSPEDRAGKTAAFTAICEHLDEIAPDNVTFGALIADPGQFGFYKNDAGQPA